MLALSVRPFPIVLSGRLPFHSWPNARLVSDKHGPVNMCAELVPCLLRGGSESVCHSSLILLSLWRSSTLAPGRLIGRRHVGLGRGRLWLLALHGRRGSSGVALARPAAATTAIGRCLRGAGRLGGRRGGSSGGVALARPTTSARRPRVHRRRRLGDAGGGGEDLGLAEASLRTASSSTRRAIVNSLLLLLLRVGLSGAAATALDGLGWGF